MSPLQPLEELRRIVREEEPAVLCTLFEVSDSRAATAIVGNWKVEAIPDSLAAHLTAAQASRFVKDENFLTLSISHHHQGLLLLRDIRSTSNPHALVHPVLCGELLSEFSKKGSTSETREAFQKQLLATSDAQSWQLRGITKLEIAFDGSPYNTVEWKSINFANSQWNKQVALVELLRKTVNLKYLSLKGTDYVSPLSAMNSYFTDIFLVCPPHLTHVTMNTIPAKAIQAFLRDCSNEILHLEIIDCMTVQASSDWMYGLGEWEYSGSTRDMHVLPKVRYIRLYDHSPYRSNRSDEDYGQMVLYMLHVQGEAYNNVQEEDKIAASDEEGYGSDISDDSEPFRNMCPISQIDEDDAIAGSPTLRLIEVSRSYTEHHLSVLFKKLKPPSRPVSALWEDSNLPGWLPRVRRI